MALQKNIQLIRWLVITCSFVIVAAILWNTYIFFQKFKTEERAKMEILAGAFERFGKADLNADFSLEDKIIGKNHNIPMIITNENASIIEWANLNEEKAKITAYLEGQLQKMKNQNDPILVSHKRGNIKQYIY